MFQGAQVDKEIPKCRGKKICLKTHGNKFLFSWETNRWEESCSWKHTLGASCGYRKHCWGLIPLVHEGMVTLMLSLALLCPSHRAGSCSHPPHLPSPVNWTNPAMMTDSRSHPSWTETNLSTPRNRFTW